MDRGLIRDDQFKMLSYLAFSGESKQIIALLTKCARKLKQFQRVSFILEALSTFIIFIILSFIPLLLSQSKYLIVLLAMLYLVFHALVIFFRLVKLHYLNKYTKITEDLSDNMLSAVFDDYRLSLGDKLPDLARVKEVTSDLSQAAHSLREYQRFIREMIGVVSGLLILLALGIYFRYMLFVHVGVLVSVIIILFVTYSLLEAMHSAYLLDYKKGNIKLDDSFVYSHPLLTRTSLEFDPKTYMEDLRPITVLFDNINIVSIVNRSLLPVLLLFMPLLLGDIAGGVYLLVVGLFISNRLFLVQNPVLHRAKVIRGEHRLKQLDLYLDEILNKGSELTPSRYKRTQKELLGRSTDLKIGDRVMWGDLKINNMNYYTGWTKNKRQIYVDDISLPYGKVSFLIGDFGVGKTLFGRLLTLRYSNFEADVLAIGDKDLRTFSELDEALRYLHFSSFRSISTSYRNALSVYVKEAGRSNLLIKKILGFEGEAESVIRHFTSHKQYYGDLSVLIAQVLEEKGVRVERDDLERGYFNLAADLFKNFSYGKSTYQTLRELKSRIDEDVFNKALTIAAVAEFLSYGHMKNYVPESNVFYMDADLSKPPISEEMRLRFLYSLDVFMKGLLLVVDEPFGQLEEENAALVLDDLVNYAKSYNAVVIILDEKLYHDNLNKYKGQGVLGKIMRFEDEGFSLSIRANDLE